MADLEGESVMNTQTRLRSSIEEKFELIASGHDIALVPESVARSYPRADLAYLPIADGPRSETCLVTTDGRRTDHLVDFLDIATESLRA